MTSTLIVLRCAAVGCIALFFGSAMVVGSARAADTGDGSGATPVCNISDDDDEVGPTALRFRFGGGCLQFSGYTQFTGQWGSVSEPRFGNVPTALRYMTNEFDGRIDFGRLTANGWFKLAFETDYSWNTDTGPDDLPNLDEASASYVGITIGFTSSLMEFWDGAFQFKASAPSLSTYLVSKEFTLSEALKLAFAVEAGPPSSRGASSWQLPDDPPYFSSRLKYENNDWIVQASIAARSIEVNRSPLVSELAQDKVGWAATVGVTVPLAFIAEDDNASLVFTYAIDSRVFLGTPNDASALASIIPSAAPLPSKGWSALASYQHYWTETLSSNVFASHVQVDLEHVLGSPFVRTNRYAANIIFEPTKNWEFGAEAAYIDTLIQPNGVFGVLKGASLRGETGFLWVKRKF